MALNIKDSRTEELAAEVADLTGESKTGAIRHSLEDRLEQLVERSRGGDRAERLSRFLRNEVWPQVPENVLGVPVTRAERESVLGYGSEGM